MEQSARCRAGVSSSAVWGVEVCDRRQNWNNIKYYYSHGLDMETVTLILTLDLESPFAIRNVLEATIAEMQAHTTAPITDFSIVEEGDLRQEAV